MKPQLHWSHLSMYTKCGEQFRRRYVEGEILPPGVGAVAGTAMHKGIELDLRHKLETGALAPAEEVVETARDSVAKTFDSPLGVFLSDEEKAEGEKAVLGKTIDAAVACSALHHRELAPLARPVRVERKWVLELDNFPFDLGGTIDCDEGGAIWDWKSSKYAPADDEAETSGQVSLYSLAKKAHDGAFPLVRLGYVVKTKALYTVVQETRRDKGSVAPMIAALERIAAGIEREVFPFAASMSPRPWWCGPKWCGYYSTCPGVCGRVTVGF